MYLPDVIGARNSRRTFLGRTVAGLGTAALAGLLGQPVLADPASGQPAKGVIDPLHFPAKAKRVIWLCMAGGMSHLESFDYKPELAKLHGQPMPESFTQGQPIAQLQGQTLKCFAPAAPVQEIRPIGQEICDIFPKIGTIADELCIIRSMKTEAINHDPAHTFMNTGSTISGRPSMGSWLLYGLGAETQNLPGFVVMMSTGKFGQSQPIASRQWHNGFLPSRFQGVEFRSTGDPVMYVADAAGCVRQPAVRRRRRRSTRSTINFTTRWTIPKSPPASPSMKWRSGCRPASRS